MSSNNLRTIKTALQLNTAVMLTKDQCRDLLNELNEAERMRADLSALKNTVGHSAVEVILALERSIAAHQSALTDAIEALEQCAHESVSHNYAQSVAIDALDKIAEVRK